MAANRPGLRGRHDLGLVGLAPGLMSRLGQLAASSALQPAADEGVAARYAS